MHWNDPNDFIGFAAALAVLASFSMSSIIQLRSVAILSNVLFITYGALGHIHPVLLLHAVLLPINLIKLHRISRLPQADGGSAQPAATNIGPIASLQRRTSSSADRPRPLAALVRELKWF